MSVFKTCQIDKIHIVHYAFVSILLLCVLVTRSVVCIPDESSLHSGTEYVYDYETKISLRTGGQHEDGLGWFEMDEKLINETVFSSSSDTFKVASTIKVAKVWTGNHNSLIRFKLEDLFVGAERNKNPFSKKANDQLQSIFDANGPQTFYALFNSDCNPQSIYTSEPKEDETFSTSTKNFLRGVLNLFQYEVKSWSGRSLDVYGNCDVNQTLDGSSMQIEKKNCQKSKAEKRQDFSENVLENNNLFASTTFRTVHGNYRFAKTEGARDLCGKIRKPVKNKSTSIVIENLEMIETLRTKLNLHHDIGTLLQSKQMLILRDQTPLRIDEPFQISNENSLFEDLPELLSEKTDLKIKGHDLQFEIDSTLASKFGHKLVSSNQIKNALSKNKPKLRTKFLATKNSAKAFSQLKKLFSSSFSVDVKKEDLKTLLTDPKNKDIWPQLMDVFGASRNVMAHEAVMEVFGNPVQTKRPDLCERYFWALSQMENTPGKVAKDLLKFVKGKGKVENEKLAETTMYTIATLSRTTEDPKASALLLKYLLNLLTSCKSPECIELFVNALQNTQNPKLAPVFLNLVEENCRVEPGLNDKKLKGRKLVAIAAMKGLAAIPVDEVFKVVDGNNGQQEGKLEGKLMDIFVDKSVDSSLRGMIVEVLVSKSLHNPLKRVSVSTVRRIIKCLSSDVKPSEKEFSGFMMSRLYELASEDLYLKKILWQLTSEGVINWDLLSSGSFSSTFSRELSSSAAGKSGFSFGLEVSGMMLKRSNLEFFFDSPIKTSETSRRTKLVQLDTFAGGMSSYFGGGNDKSAETDETEPYAGLQLTVRKTKLRPFVFFRTSSEVMSLYWSGALEQKNSALSGNMMVEDENQLIFFSNGMVLNLVSNGIISFDSSGQAKVSIWSKTSNTKVENSGAYSLERRSILNLFHKNFFISHKENVDIPMGLNSETEIDFSGDNVEMCIKMNQSNLLLSYERTQSTEYGKKTKTTKSRRKKTFVGKTLALSNKIMELCNKMHPKTR